MSSSRLILELNRRLHPNPFNTGPPIPRTPQHFVHEDPSRTASPFSSVDSETHRHGAGTPDLTCSPSSSVSSLTLEDDEVRKIFSGSRYVGSGAAISLEAEQLIAQQKDELNPFAAPFVPSFAIYSGLHNPVNNWIDSNRSYTPPPIDLAVKPLDIAVSQDTNDQSAVLENALHLHTKSLPPFHPPGLRQPPIRAIYEMHPEDLNPPCPPPQYLPVFLDALKPERTTRERGVLASVIVTIMDDWNMDSLLELAERFGIEACNPAPDLMCGEESVQATIEDDPLVLSGRAHCRQSHQAKVAELAAALQVCFNQHHKDVGRFFAWNLRETVLTRFINYWDCTKPGAITSAARPSVQYVQSALTLCKSVSALFSQNLISHGHISMCISILMKNLESVEHVRALADLVLGCGLAFWKPDGTDTKTVSASSGTLTEDTSLLRQDDFDSVKSRVGKHVTSFLIGLETNVLGRKLTEKDSVMGQPWEKGKLLATVQELVDAVKYWEAGIMTGR